MTSQRVAWLVTLGMTLIIVAGACIPGGAAIPMTTSTASPDPTIVGPSAPPSPSGPSGRPTFTYPTPTPLPTFLVYTVRSGDTLTSIAREHSTTARSIAFWNRQRYPSLDPDSPRYRPNRIEVGWQLLLIPEVELDPEDLPQPSPPMPASPSTSASGRTGSSGGADTRRPIEGQAKSARRVALVVRERQLPFRIGHEQR